jgi:hypothetical protein
MEYCEIIRARVFDKNPQHKYNFIKQNHKAIMLRDKT